MLMGVIQDSPTTATCLNKIGCTNKRCGRRAPHSIWAIVVIMIACLITHLPPNMMNMMTAVDSDRLLADVSFRSYRVSTSIDDGKPTWGEWQTYPAGGLMSSTNGYPCDKMMEFNSTSGKIHSFVRVDKMTYQFQSLVVIFAPVWFLWRELLSWS